MEGIILKILPPLLIFFIGYLLKRLNILKKEDGDTMLKIVFYVAAPSLILRSLSTVELDASLLYIVLTVVSIIFVSFLAAKLLAKTFHLERKQLGVFLISAMILNTWFLLPFIVSLYDQATLAKFLLFDGTNAIITYSLVYFIAAKHGSGTKDNALITQKIFLSPVIWAIIVALTMNLLNVTMPNAIANLIQLTGSLAVPLIMLSLGAYFSLKIVNLPYAVTGVLLRMVGGLLLGALLTHLFHFEGTTRVVIMVAAAAPIGFNTLTFSSLEKLDREFAASLISVSLLFALAFIPALFLVLK